MRERTMKRIEELATGLTILAKYDDTGFSAQAEHDIIYAGPHEENIVTKERGGGGVYGSVVSREDADKLVSLGWHISSETDTWAFFT